MNDLICAIATPRGSAGVAIIRISGDGAVEFANKFCFTNKIIEHDFNTIFLEKIVFNGELFDEVLISKFKKNKSFTGEEVVEINCHGGSFLTNTILNNILKYDEIRIAEPGEFSKRAFVNGKISLNKAQGIIDLINSHSDTTRKMAIRAFEDKNIKLLEEQYGLLMNEITSIQASIDYPEYDDIETSSYETLLQFIKQFNLNMNKLLKDTNYGLIIKDGISTSIIGQPNVGKSTLLNKLSKQQKAIVTDVAGTTRDIIEVDVLLGDLKLNLKDTAGIRETDDLVESIGIQLSLDAIEESELVIFITDSTQSNREKDVELFNKIKHKKYIVLNNKIEIGENKHIEESIDISLNNDNSIGIIEEAITKLFGLDSFDADNATYLVNNEHKVTLEKVCDISSSLLQEIEQNAPLDLIEIDLKELTYLLGDILGIETKNDIINEMFSRFCLGK